MRRSTGSDKSIRAAFFAVIGLLAVGIIFFAVRAVGAYSDALTELSASPTPSPSYGLTFVTGDPNSPTPEPTAAPPVLRSGSSETEEVKKLQTLLAGLGYYSDAIDGDFGGGTENAVKLFQAQHGLDADGIYGLRSRRVLESDLAEEYIPTPSPEPTETPAPTDTPEPVAATANAVVVSDTLPPTKEPTRVPVTASPKPPATPKPTPKPTELSLALADDAGLTGQEIAAAISMAKAQSNAPKEGSISVQTNAQDGSFAGVSVSIDWSKFPDGLLKKNSKNTEAVMQLQTALTALGYYTGAIDGDFGAGTAKSVTNFQKSVLLEGDGVVGSGTVTALKNAIAALADIDISELPLLINDEFPIAENYSPYDLIALRDVLPNSLVKLEDSDTEANREAAGALKQMLTDAKSEGYDDWKIAAAYRTYDYQKTLFNRYVNNYMKNGDTRSQAISRTRNTVADPGTSEHHTGLAFDLNVIDETFGNTKHFKWLKQHCWDYGFILRFQAVKKTYTKISAEAWHYRYVGVKHAKIMQATGWCLEEYVAYLKNLQAKQQ